MYPLVKGRALFKICACTRRVYFLFVWFFFYHRLESTGCKNIYKIFFALLTIFKLSFLLSTK